MVGSATIAGYEMSDDKIELPTIPSRVSLIIGGERYETLVEDVELVHEDSFDRMYLKLVSPSKLDRADVIKLARALMESSIAKPMQGPIDEAKRIDTPAQAKEEFGGEKPIEHKPRGEKVMLEEAIEDARAVAA